jgi:hypothetical protein
LQAGAAAVPVPVGDLLILANVTTTISAGEIEGRAAGSVLIAGAVVSTPTGSIGTLPLTVTAFSPPKPNGFNIDIDLTADITVTILDGDGSNFQVDIDWLPEVTNPALEVTYPPIGGPLTPVPGYTANIDGDPKPDPVVRVYTIPYQFLLIDLRSRDNPAATIVVPVTVTFDYRAGQKNGIEFFDQDGAVRVRTTVLVDVEPPALGFISVGGVEEEKKSLVYDQPEPLAVQESRSFENPSVEILTPLLGAAIDPQDHLELWRVTARGEEVFVRAWPDGDASVLDDLPRLFKDLQNDHYRLYVVRAGKKLQAYFNILIKDGIPLPAPRMAVDGRAESPPPGAGPQPVADRPVSPQELPPAVDAPVPAARPDDSELGRSPAPPAEEDAPSGGPRAAAVSAAAAAVLLHPSQPAWERRLDEALRAGSGRSLSKLGRSVRRHRSQPK